MKYYLLQTSATAPFIEMKLVARTTEEYNKDPSLSSNPLVIDENNLPVFKDGIANIKVAEGEIVVLSEEETQAAAALNVNAVSTHETEVANAEIAYKESVKAYIESTT